MAGYPPLKSLEAFDAAARHLSFQRAAEELNITPTAVSHRIRTLEDHLGRKLFHRLPRALRLTPDGAAYAPWIRQAFQSFRQAGTALEDASARGELVVTATMSFATNWLAPRLHRFSSQYPDIAVRLVATDDVLDFARHGIDVAIRYGRGEVGDLFAAWVLTDAAIPVCSPTRLTAKGQTLTADELRRLPLIQYEWRGYKPGDPGWLLWWDSVDPARPAPANASVFGDEHMCIQAAIDGHGVALVGLLAAAREIESGRLAVVHPQSLPSKSCYFTCAPQNADLPKFVAFRDWLLAEADDFRDGPVGAMLDGIA